MKKKQLSYNLKEAYKALEASQKIEKMTENHLRLAESEIKRLNVIINYLETKDMK